MAEEIIDEIIRKHFAGFMIFRYPKWEFKQNSRRTYELARAIYNQFPQRKLIKREIVKREIPKGETLRYFDLDAKRMTTILFLLPYPDVILKEGETVWMSIAPWELDMMRHYADLSRGSILAGGLGLGIYQYFANLRKPLVREIDAVEIDSECIDLVQSFVPETKIVQGDFWEYLESTSKRYDTVFVDIWPGVITAYDDYKRAKEGAKKVLKPTGRSIVWMEELLKVIERRLPKEPMAPTGAFGYYEPCLICGKILRNDYAGLCMDCADGLGVSELFVRR